MFKLYVQPKLKIEQGSWKLPILYRCILSYHWIWGLPKLQSTKYSIGIRFIRFTFNCLNSDF